MDVFLFVVVLVALSVGAKTLKSFLDYRLNCENLKFKTNNMDKVMYSRSWQR